MARRRRSARYDPNYRTTPGAPGKRKSDAEARVERLTWFLLVIIFAALNMLPERTIPNAIIPFSRCRAAGSGATSISDAEGQPAHLIAGTHHAGLRACITCCRA
jgi:hypothetical protein